MSPWLTSEWSNNISGKKLFTIRREKIGKYKFKRTHTHTHTQKLVVHLFSRFTISKKLSSKGK